MYTFIFIHIYVYIHMCATQSFGGSACAQLLNVTVLEDLQLSVVALRAALLYMYTCLHVLYVRCIYLYIHIYTCCIDVLNIYIHTYICPCKHSHIYK